MNEETLTQWWDVAPKANKKTNKQPFGIEVQCQLGMIRGIRISPTIQRLVAFKTLVLPCTQLSYLESIRRKNFALSSQSWMGKRTNFKKFVDLLSVFEQWTKSQLSELLDHETDGTTVL